ncbi:hypothetical protein L2E82_21994 [Cichorium intybus]|uniref:Uncharacterized protein n=1 Tax=Cichorium intybus TaxID=13427 RepID=A0ACB9DX01_CICIN|nr:hypothetical protein L2E82_21994 [Cichorium intybus]
MKHYADLGRKEMEFQVGERVFLKLRPYRRQSLVRHTHPKLAARYYGPFLILEKIGKVAYRLALPETARIHPVFHISQLQKAIGNGVATSLIPVQLTEEVELCVEPETVLAVRPSQHQGELEILVKWKDLPELEASWENLSAMVQQFPDSHLEDKVLLLQGVLISPG